MRKVKLILSVVMLTLMGGVLLESCKKDESPSSLKLVSVQSNDGTALDAATSATSVSTTASVVATFDREVDVATANSSNIAINSGVTTVPSTITASGNTVTIVPTNGLSPGTNYTVSITSGLKATSGGSASPAEFTFKTVGRANVVAPQGASQLSYFSFSGTVKDEVGTHTPAASDIVALTYTADRFGFAGQAASFNGTTTIVEIPNGQQYMGTANFSISFWFKPSSAKEGHFVLGLAGYKGFQFEVQGGAWTAADKGVNLAVQYSLAGGASDAENSSWNGVLNGWQGSTFTKVQTNAISTNFQDKWANVVFTFMGSTKIATMYVNGDKVRSFDFNLWPNGDAKATASGTKFAGNLTGGGNNLALGFFQGRNNPAITDSFAVYSDTNTNHFLGAMDDVRIWNATLSGTEVLTLYNAEKP